MHGHPASVVGRCESPWRVIDPRPSPRFDPRPATTFIRCPARPNVGDPDRSIHLVSDPSAELIQIVVPDEIARDVQLCLHAIGTAIAFVTPVFPLVWKGCVSNFWRLSRESRNDRRPVLVEIELRGSGLDMYATLAYRHRRPVRFAYVRTVEAHFQNQHCSMRRADLNA